jgi:hypothetical protein
MTTVTTPEPAGPYRTSPTRRARRSRAEISTIEDALYQTAKENTPATVRQIYYRLVSEGIIEKTETEYKATVCRLLSKMRREGRIPYSWISDNTRWIMRPATFDSVEDALFQTARTYRRSIWSNLPERVEIWCEKDALAGVLYEETSIWAAPLMVVRGYASLTFLHAVAEEIRHGEKPTYIYYFGDHDPSGVDAQRFVERELRGFAGDVPLHFIRAAVTPDQINSMGLLTRETKKSDSRSKGFLGGSVEVDAIPPRTLRQMVRECIMWHVSERELSVLEEAEHNERALLTSIARGTA